MEWMAAGAVVAGAGMSFWGVMWATSIQTQVPRDVLNRIHAYDVAGSLAMTPVGQALAGPAAGVFGTRHVLLAGGVTTVLVAAALLSVPAIRGLIRVDSTVPVPGRNPGKSASTPEPAQRGSH